MIVRPHGTHYDDCGCLTVRYKIAINALIALKAHWDIVSAQTGKLSTVSHILDNAFRQMEELDKEMKQ